MILTASFLICKALGVTWSWWWLVLTAVVDGAFTQNIDIREK